MGVRFRKSVKLGPARINFSKSGIGWSIGGKGMRFTKKAGGGYRTTTSIPGTGVSYSKDFSENSSKQGNDSATNNEPAKKRGCGCFTVIGLIMLLIFASSLIGKVGDLFTSGKLVKPPKEAVYSEEIPWDSVWYQGTGIIFKAYPGTVAPGDETYLRIEGNKNTDYGIQVYTGSTPMHSTSLLTTTSNKSGSVAWTWSVPDNCEPGIYYIQISDRFGNENRIDYAILDSSGNIVGMPPDRNPVVPEKDTDDGDYKYDYGEGLPEEDSTLPTYVETDNSNSNIVYVTKSGSKFHKRSCSHISDSDVIVMTRDQALSDNYTACKSCNP